MWVICINVYFEYNSNILCPKSYIVVLNFVSKGLEVIQNIRIFNRFCAFQCSFVTSAHLFVHTSFLHSPTTKRNMVPNFKRHSNIKYRHNLRQSIFDRSWWQHRVQWLLKCIEFSYWIVYLFSLKSTLLWVILLE